MTDNAINYDLRTIPNPNRKSFASAANSGSTDWLVLKNRTNTNIREEHVFTSNVENISAAVGTFFVEAQQRLDDTETYGTSKTIYSSSTLTDYPQVGRISGNWRVRLSCTWTSGSYNLVISQ